MVKETRFILLAYSTQPNFSHGATNIHNVDHFGHLIQPSNKNGTLIYPTQHKEDIFDLFSQLSFKDIILFQLSIV
jgi:hypothetical protein